MDKAMQIADRLWELMESRDYPVSVMETVVGVIDWASNPLKTAMDLEPMVMAAKNPREVVKAVQMFVE